MIDSPLPDMGPVCRLVETAGPLWLDLDRQDAHNLIVMLTAWLDETRPATAPLAEAAGCCPHLYQIRAGSVVYVTTGGRIACQACAGPTATGNGGTPRVAGLGEWVEGACGCIWREHRPPGLTIDPAEPRVCSAHLADHPASVRLSPQGMAMVPVTYHHHRPGIAELGRG